MKQTVKQILIFILIFIAILLVFGVLLYDYIPINQVVPTISEYKATEEVKEQLKEIATEDTSDIVLTYEVSESDLGIYENTKNYDKGKANPFSSYSSGQTVDSSESTATQNNANGSTNVNTTNSSTQSNTNSTNSINTNNSSQNTNTFYEDSRN